MEPWLVGTKLAIVLFVVVRWIETGSQNGTAAVLLVLSYVGLTALYHIVKAPRWKQLLSALTLAQSVLSALLFSPLFVYVVPLAGAELVATFSASFRYSPIPALAAFILLPTAFWSEYLLCAAFSLLVFAVVTRLGTRMGALSRENESLRASNELQRKRLLASEEYERQVRRVVQLEERNRLAQEVHDRVGHTIAGSVVQLEAASALLASNPARAGEMMSRSVEVLREGMESMRLTLRGIKPQQEELGLERLRSVLDRFTATSSIQSHLTHSGDPAAISPARWAVILDNTREALTNVVKHSGATRVAVSIEILAKLLKLEIRDDGRGTYAVKKGLGLQGIEERLRAERGTLIIDGSDGFSLIMLFPRSEGSDGD